MGRELMQGVEFSHFLIKQQLEKGDITIDATAGNGRDTIFMAQQVGPEGKVLAFDIQQEALNRAQEKLIKSNLKDRVTLIEDSHENIKDYVKENSTAAIIFNLGYLPGGDKDIITEAATTVRAAKSGLNLLKVNGLMVLVIYTGHPGGKKEQQQLLKYACKLPTEKYNVLHYHYLNQDKPPAQVLAIKKRTEGV